MCANFRILANYRKFIENRKTPVNLDLIGLRVFYKLVKNFKKLFKNASLWAVWAVCVGVPFA